LHSATHKLEAERAELEAVLTSGVLGRSNNLVRLLTFVCEKYFEGTIDEVKEYSIAVQALGRSDDFDPQVDTIVRVTAHALRKRLEDYYRTAGGDHSIHICLPAGHYAPKFVHKRESDLPVASGAHESNGARKNGFQPHQQMEAVAPPLAKKPEDAETPREIDPEKFTGLRIASLRRLFVVVALALCILAALVWYRSDQTTRHENKPQARAAMTPVSSSGKALRAMAGDDRISYVDRSGFTWEKDQFCTGGSSFSVSGRPIQGTEDSALYSTGRQGIFNCKYPVAPGTYEVHLLFAETSRVPQSIRYVTYSINNGPANTVDVADDAGGNDIAITKVHLDVTPGRDGMIHLDFTTNDSFLNAIEILPSTPHKILPVRIIAASPTLFNDSEGNLWLPDRYYFGGRASRFAGDLSRIPDGVIYDWHRFGHFHYVVPVAANRTYTLKLHFLEHWFGIAVAGGAGSRIFDVSCNGTMLLKRFDIWKEGGNKPLVKTFTHIEPTAQGKLEIYFTPATNYPSVSAIEVIGE
jgi:Malectin domain